MVLIGQYVAVCVFSELALNVFEHRKKKCVATDSTLNGLCLLHMLCNVRAALSRIECIWELLSSWTGKNVILAIVDSQSEEQTFLFEQLQLTSLIFYWCVAVGLYLKAIIGSQILWNLRQFYSSKLHDKKEVNEQICIFLSLVLISFYLTVFSNGTDNG